MLCGYRDVAMTTNGWCRHLYHYAVTKIWQMQRSREFLGYDDDDDELLLLLLLLLPLLLSLLLVI